MYTRIFNVFSTRAISICFNCDNCNQQIDEIIEDIPTPNFESERDTYYGTLEQTYPDIVCPNCQKDFGCIVQASNAGGEFYLNNLSDDANIQFYCDEFDETFFEAIDSNTKYYETFELQILNLSLLLQNLPSDTELVDIQLKMIATNAITTMETYLSDAYINTILGNKKYLQEYVENFYDVKIQLKDIFKIYNSIEKNVRNNLLKVLYHRIDSVEPMYKKVLGISFTNTKEIKQLVQQRHNLVHRNGKDENGNPIILDRKIVETNLLIISDFIKSIDTQLKATIGC